MFYDIYLPWVFGANGNKRGAACKYSGTSNYITYLNIFMTNELIHFKVLNFLTQLPSCQINILVFLVGPLVAQSCSFPSETSNFELSRTAEQWCIQKRRIKTLLSSFCLLNTTLNFGRKITWNLSCVTFRFIPCILNTKCILYTNICTNKWCKFVLYCADMFRC